MATSKILPGKDVSFTFELPPPSRSQIVVPLHVDGAVGIGGSTWPAAELFCDFMISPRFYAFFRKIISGRSVCELGSGNGLVGVLVDKAFAPRRVSVTDMPSHVPLIAHNLALNNCTVESGGGSCSAEAINWFDYHKKGNATTGEKFDVILALECVYREELFEPLIHTIISLSHEDTTILLGITRSFASPKFFDLLEAHGLDYRKVPIDTVRRSGLVNKRQHCESLVGFFFIRRSPFKGDFLSSIAAQQQ